MTSTKATQPGGDGAAHIVTIGTTPSGGGPGDVVEAIARDLAPQKPAFVTVLATPGSEDNAKRLLDALRMPTARRRVVVMDSHISLDDAYRRATEEIEHLLQKGFTRSRIVLDYTAGTKVMAGGALLAAVGSDVFALRYLGAPETRGGSSVAVKTAPRAVLAHRELRDAMELFFELRFAKAASVASDIDPAFLAREGTEDRELLRLLGPAFDAWDNFHASGFLTRYRTVESRIPSRGRLKGMKVAHQALAMLETVASAEDTPGAFPVELLYDLYNNAVRRLFERRFDDALSRLYRAAELYAQMILLQDYNLRADNLDIRRVPPRSRMLFEANRRLDDTTIKLALRTSYQLLDVLGHKVGVAFHDSTEFNDLLNARRTLVLAHGTRPCPPEVALRMLRLLESFFQITLPDFAVRAEVLQFPWLHNAEIIRAVEREAGIMPAPKPTAHKSAPAKAPAPRDHARKGDGDAKTSRPPSPARSASRRRR